MKKVFAKMTLANLSGEQKIRRKETCSDLSAKLLEKTYLLEKVVTSDGTWIFSQQTRNKMPKFLMEKFRVS
jgi:hypothetical protein